jgi:hypothetical protein
LQKRSDIIRNSNQNIIKISVRAINIVKLIGLINGYVNQLFSISKRKDDASRCFSRKAFKNVWKRGYDSITENE